MPTYSCDLRERIIAAREDGHSAEEVARLFRVSRRSVERYWKTYQTTGAVEPKQRGGYRRSCLEGHDGRLRAWIGEKKDLTLAQLRERIDHRQSLLPQGAGSGRSHCRPWSAALLSACLQPGPQSHRDGIFKTQSAPAPGGCPTLERPAGSRRSRPGHLLGGTMPQLPSSCPICDRLNRKCSNANQEIGGPGDSRVAPN